jgi:hypothetical protein
MGSGVYEVAQSGKGSGRIKFTVSLSVVFPIPADNS